MHRNSYTPDAPDQVKTQPKKDRNKWCKGKVGVEHQFGEPVLLFERWSRLAEKRCSVCGKKRIVVI